MELHELSDSSFQLFKFYKLSKSTHIQTQFQLQSMS